VVGLGASCASTYTACGAGLYCDGASSICTARKALGAACNGIDQCVEGIRCDPGSLTCQAWLKIGDPCVAGELKCGGKAHCGTGGKCVASPVLGADCTPIPGEPVFCQIGWCAPAVLPATTRTCVPHAAPGAACDTTNTLQCGLGYTCNVVGSGTVGTCGRNYCGAF
jgi:hypothetical protein